MDWIKQHADTIIILGTFATCFWNMNEKFNERFNQIDKDLTMIKTVLILKNIIPIEMVVLHDAKVKDA